MSTVYSISLLNGIQTLTITRPTLDLNLKAGKPYSVTWKGVKEYPDVKALDLDIYEKHPGCQCLIRFANGLAAIASTEVLGNSKTGWNSDTKHNCKVLQCSDLILLASDALAA